ncbi:UDP-4-amino-4,6-dideoxy-N-acetyl-beta-L-altrosamine N-acetyltransferase [Pseudomonas panipatensis]|uniref:UDP-4-amino-4,6-dideoxy-N-acetyl-beta-L-altrosamine N-acetyltransferase n=1 Tax=Pseudomonas panipatensis TaxID=428992 RepID=A0A1G8DM43_9PSED|nr:UDP-4-amino-4,6-dideoxy-N-acetyl-beta-L-altrosamine N-acetyltransferase [Pseudomonas panipatensis]SDH58756.1 UDP-4-amino-4,6-dideoxy-N-acetyl-beta-L-altrosamine N-acetyltransferase [Pseudomonas panipatensis]SMP40875.1 UDP-4-amino-4,6-dideoxy-N-acetyl-beta-L-altrosamine N-acetyltransferase [Pseudomonas panipatensis]
MHSLRPLERADLPLVLSWRNHPAISRYMCNQHHIELEEHLRWFERVSQDPRQELLIYEVGDRPWGYLNFTHKAQGEIAEWGFYVAPDAQRGTGTCMTSSALRFAFANRGLHKLSAQVLAYNERSIHLHRKLGFQQEGLLRAQHFCGEKYHDIYCFGLLASEWKASPEESK